jgi:hypothetical protein
MPPLVFGTLLKPFCNLKHLTYSNYGEAEPPFSFYPHEVRLGYYPLAAVTEGADHNKQPRRDRDNGLSDGRE